jgi:CheY-like chemotaxis protein
VLEHQPINIADIVAEVRSMMSLRAAEKNLMLNLVTEPREAFEVYGDAVRLQQILTNLVSNAIKFTEEGYVNILTRAEDMPDGRVQIAIEIADSGIGMSPQQVARVFEKFVQADASITRRYGGTGLGLAITRQLTELMGGDIAVESREGGGSRFTLRLPFRRVEPAALPDRRSLEPAQPYAHRGRVLLVEDYEGNLIVATALLEELGYEVTVAHNGREALERCEGAHFDLVLMDVQMPEMDGYEATRLMRERQAAGHLPAVPIIGVTANALVGDRQKCLDAGMDDYISKPFTAEQLAVVVARHDPIEVPGS